MEWYSPRASINSSAHCELCDTKECICEKNINHFIFRLVLLTRSYRTKTCCVCWMRQGGYNYPSLENLFYFWIVSSLLLLYSICALAKKHSPFIRAYFFVHNKRRPKRIGASSWAAKFIMCASTSSSSSSSTLLHWSGYVPVIFIEITLMKELYEG